MELYVLIVGAINAATDFVLLALVSERDATDMMPKIKRLIKGQMGVADTDSLASEDQPTAETRPDRNFHRGPRVSDSHPSTIQFPVYSSHC